MLILRGHCEEPFDFATLRSGQAPRRSNLTRSDEERQRLLRRVYPEPVEGLAMTTPIFIVVNH
jgi:hypothetical protein